jgi:hypothetical protein
MTLSSKVRIGFNIWMILLIMLTLFAQLPLYILAPSNFRAMQLAMVTNIVYTWTAVLSVVIALNIGAFFMVNKLQKHRKIVSEASRSNGGDLDAILLRIKRAAAGISITVFLLIFFLNYMLPQFRRTVVSDPRCDITTEGTCFRFAIACWLIAFGIPLWFVSPILHDRQNRHRTRVTSNKMSSQIVSNKI